MVTPWQPYGGRMNRNRILEFLLLGAMAQAACAQQPARARYARNRTFDQQHVKLEVRFDLPKKQLIGTATLTLAPLATGLREVELDAADMRIKEVKVGAVLAKFRHEGERLTVTLPQPGAAGVPIVLTIPYETDSQARANRPAGGFGAANGLRFVLPDPEDPKRKAQIWTQGEPETNHFWWPGYDYPNDLTTSEIIIHTAGGWVAVSNGRLLRHARMNGNAVWHWKQEQPHAPYLLSIVAGELEQVMDKWQDVPLHFVGPRDSGVAKLRNAFEHTPAMLSLFSRLTGVKYPWAKYAQSAMTEFGGGMENTSATTVGVGVLHDDRAHLDLDNESLNAHELAHQWFGDLVTCKDWSQIWLNEGFATFCANLWIRESKGEDEFRFGLDGEVRSSVFADQNQRRPIVYNVYNNPLSVLGAFAYPKPAAVLHMLRTELGDELFWRGVNAYLRQHRHRNADTHQFRRAMEEATGRDLEEWFQQWLLSPGHPDFKVRWEWLEPTRAARIVVQQTQKQEGGVPLYKVPVKIGCLVAGEWRDFTVLCDKAEQEFQFPLPTRPSLVLFDKQRDLLKTLDFARSTEEEIARLHQAPAAPDRLEALQKLSSQLGDPRVVEAIGLAFRAEKHHRIRGEAARLLAPLGAAQVELLLAALSTQQPSPADKHGSKLRRTIIDALAQVKNRTDVVVKLRGLVETDESYFVRSAALNALVRIDPKSPGNWEVFVRATQQDSHDEVVRRAAFEALTQADSERAVALVLPFTDLQQPMAVRQAAISICERLARGNARVREQLVALLDTTKSPAIKRSVIRALSFRGDKEAIPALQAFVAREPDEPLKQAAQNAIRQLTGGTAPTPGPPLRR